MRATAILLSVAVMGCGSHRPWAHAAEAVPGPSSRAIRVAVAERGFEPDRVVVQAGETVELIFTRTVEHTCVTSVVVSLDADTRIERGLPLGVAVTVTLAFAREQPGELGFACPMGMHGGVIEVR